MEENKIMSAPSVDRNSNALATLLAEVEKSLELHDYVTGGVDYGYISTGLQAAFDAVKSAAAQQVDAVQAVPGEMVRERSLKLLSENAKLRTALNVIADISRPQMKLNLAAPVGSKDAAAYDYQLTARKALK